MSPSLLASVAIILFQREETRSNLDLTTVNYNNNKLSIVEEGSQRTYKSQHFEWLSSYVINTIVKKSWKSEITPRSLIESVRNMHLSHSLLLWLTEMVFLVKVMTRVLSVISFIQLAAHQQRMESVSDIRSVQSVAELTVDRNWISIQNTFHVNFLQYYHPVLIFALVCITSYVSTFLPSASELPACPSDTNSMEMKLSIEQWAEWSFIKNEIIWRKTCPSAILSTTNPTCAVPG